MKKVIILGIAILLFLTALWVMIFISRQTSYTIKTDGKLYIVNKLSSSITVFDLYNGKKITEIPLEVVPHEITSLPKQNKVVVGDFGTSYILGNSITVIDTKTNKIHKTIGLQENIAPQGIITFPKSNKIGVVTNLGNSLLIIDVRSGVIEKKIPTQQILSQLLVLHPKKPKAYVTNVNSGSVSVIDLKLNKTIKNIPCGIKTEGIDITPDGTEIWVSNVKENTISVINTANYLITNVLPAGTESLRLKFSVDGTLCLVTNANDGTITIYDQNSKKIIKTIQLPGKTSFIERILYHTPRPVGLLMHPNGQYAFVSNSNANKIEVLDLNTLTIVSSIATSKIPDGLAFVQ